MTTPVLDAHRESLSRAFGLHVVEIRPESLLDVGFGAGFLLAELARRDIPVQGIERSERRVADARARGLDVREGDASALPFRTAAFDWVLMRHVLHHLDDPEVAVGEAWRVARSGVILAEPCCDPSIPSQVAMSSFDAFTSELLARAGQTHHPHLSAGRLIALVPERPGRVVTRTYGELTDVPEAEVRELALLAASERELAPQDAGSLEEFARLAAAGQLSYNGSAAVFVQRA